MFSKIAPARDDGIFVACIGSVERVFFSKLDLFQSPLALVFGCGFTRQPYFSFQLESVKTEKRNSFCMSKN